MDDFAKMNEIYCQYWGDVKPCRTYVALLMHLLQVANEPQLCRGKDVATERRC